ncbi:F28K19.11 [Arabidopsis thaliana]|uniref:F28K19.11 n=1 Tax=Arabidopsis thaliana TaxID=3702 RepID=Q9SH11_ARATH|nr:F28K19.11 [Arabidopsis thaliana]
MVGGWIRYMVQLLNLVVHKLSVPALHNLGFAVDANSFSLNFMLKTVASVTKVLVQEYGNEILIGTLIHLLQGTVCVSIRRFKRSFSMGIPFFLSSASPHSVETFRNLQQGIAHLKQSVAHLTVYGYRSLSLEVPSGTSTFETFAKLLATLSSLKEVQSGLSLGLSSSNKQRHEPNKSVWNLNSSSSSTLLNSSHTQPTTWNSSYYNVPNRDPSYMVEFPDVKKDKNSIGEWNLVEYPHSSRQPNHPNKY